MIEMMKRNFATMRERSRSRERREKAEEEDEQDRIPKKEEEEDDEEDITLSDCEDCQNLLRDLVIDDHPKLKKYLIKYEEFSRIKFES